MKYLVEIMYTALFCGLLLKIGPGKESKAGKYAKFISSLVFLAVLLSPVLDIIKSDLDFYNNFNITEGATANTESYREGSGINVVTHVICEKAAEKASEIFSVPAENFSIKISISESEGSEYTINNVKIFRKGEAAQLNTDEVQQYFEKIFNCSGEIEVE